MNKIATKTGDSGTTGLLYGTRVLKSDHRIEIVGQLDEVSAHLGVIKAELTEFLSKKSIYLSTDSAPIAYDIESALIGAQKTLIDIMGEFVVEPERLERYLKSFPILEQHHLDILEKRVEVLESDKTLVPTDWVLYGHNRISAQLDLASKVCRRAERAIWMAVLANKIACRGVITSYVNRLSDYLYLCARFFEKNWVN